MIFGALPTWQGWLFVAAAAAAAAALFLMRVRAPRVAVPSLLLWRRVLDEAREQTLWERIRRAVSLAVSVIIALALALGALQPRQAPSAGAGSTAGPLLIVLDSSPSMLARTTSGDSRWERAVAQARRLVSGAPQSDVAIATTADGLIEGPTTDRALLEAALDRAEPGAGDAGPWPRLAVDGDVHFITDGAVARALDPRIDVHSVFETAANVAVTAFDVRPAFGGRDAGTAYLEVANFAEAPQRVRILVERGSDTLLDRRVDMAAGEALRQVFPIARGSDPSLRARIEASGNALEIDDEAFAYAAGTRPRTIVLVGNDSGWLASLFEGDPAVRLSSIAEEAYRQGTNDADVIIFDRWAPRERPNRPALYFSPPDGRGAEEVRPRWDTTWSHPVVNGVDPFTLTVERARTYDWANLVAVVRSTRGTPLVYVQDSPARRAVLVTFGPAESNLTAAPAFPVLVGNALDWLTNPAPAPPKHPGLAAFDRSIARVTGPGGEALRLTRLGGDAVATLRTPGLYAAETGGARTTFAINSGDPQISNLMRTNLSASVRDNPAPPGTSRQPWWIYCAVAAFLLVLAEWWTWQRRITV